MVTQDKTAGMLKLRRVTGWLELMIDSNCLRIEATDVRATAPMWIPIACLGPCTAVEIEVKNSKPLSVTEIKWGLLGTAGKIYVYDTLAEIDTAIQAIELK